ncbi:VOC family protein [Candidatus Woesearchaeota archaeon]|nr:VOC family protein [Candidatus Woesearchaeota archaeon]
MAKQKISPCLWFDDNAEEAAKFYTSIFPNSKILEVVPYTVETPSNKPIGSVMTVYFELDGHSFLGLNGGDFFKLNPSISFLVVSKSKNEVDELWVKLSEGGKVLMEIGEYPFSQRFGWTADKFGLSWQIMLADDHYPFKHKITPTLMFVGKVCGKAEEAMKFYASIFPDSRVGDIARYPKGTEPEKEGTVMHGAVILGGQEFFAMDSAREHNFTFNEAVSLMITCSGQEEIDYFYDKLSAQPKAEMCGWLKDKYGVSWQLITPDFVKLDKNKKVMEAILKMKRLDLAKLREAYKGK